MYAIKVNNLLRHSITKNAGNLNNCNIPQTLAYITVAATVNMQSGPDSKVGLCHAKS